MRHFIDVNHCCQDGLSIVWDKWKAWENRDNRALLKLRELEDEHYEECPKCNPSLLAESLFGQPVEIGK